MDKITKLDEYTIDKNLGLISEPYINKLDLNKWLIDVIRIVGIFNMVKKDKKHFDYTIIGNFRCFVPHINDN